MDIIFTILFILVVVWVVRLIFEKLNFPFILGELLAGMVIGPSVLGLVGNSGAIFPWTPALDTLAKLGMFFLMFYAGLATDPKELGKNTKSFLSIGIPGTFVPLTLGLIVVWYFTENIWIALIMALAISGTSLATKSRILDDFDILETKLGYTMMGGGMVDNILSFILLSVALHSITEPNLGAVSIMTSLLLVTAFFVGVLLIGYYVYPVIGPMFSRPGSEGFILALVFGLLIAGVGSLAGLHFIIGAYLGGLFISEEIMSESRTEHLFNLGTYGDLKRRFRMLSHGFLGPIFIVSVAMKASFGVIKNFPLFLLALIGAATVGKLLGAGGGASLSGFNRNESFIVGMSMNGRGTVELILASLGLEMGLLTESHLSLLVFTAFTTTLLVPLILKYGTSKDYISLEKIS